ncbi:MAG: hypothetical protein MH321_13140 [Leptospiraceae bacterium]|nr:hypothetical protein [Leptospiraceae bacterium]
MIKKILVLISLIFTFALYAEDKASLGGYCPVAYVNMGKAIKGDAKFSSSANGKLYYFVNADIKKIFDKNPEQFTKPIQYDSFCATAIALSSNKIASDPEIFSEVDKKFYFFSNKEAKEMFDKDPKEFIKKADKNWKSLK